MGVPTSEVGYTSATARRGDHESSYEHVVALEKKMFSNFFPKIVPLFRKCGKVWYSHNTRRMCFARWITKATDTHSEYQHFLFSTGNNGYDLRTLPVLFLTSCFMFGNTLGLSLLPPIYESFRYLTAFLESSAPLSSDLYPLRTTQQRRCETYSSCGT